MVTIVTRRRKQSKEDEAALIARMEEAGPSGEKLRRLVKKHVAPQQWFDEVPSPARLANRRK